MLRLAFAVLGLTFASASTMFDCHWNVNEGIPAFNIKAIRVSHSNDITITWELVKRSDVIIVNRTNGMEFTQEFNKDGTLVLDARSFYSSGSVTSNKPALNQIVTVLLSISLCLPGLRLGKKAFLLLLLALCGMQVYSVPGCAFSPSIHLKIPVSYVNTMCMNGKCRPLTCNLAIFSDGVFSKVDSRNRKLFSDEMCTIKKPDRWEEWIVYYYPNLDKALTTSIYFFDSDNDGLANILEYYADLIYSGASKDSQSGWPSQISDIGTNPNLADSDGDLLLDGFEFTNKMPMKEGNSASDDEDNDGLTNLQEQIYKTDPLNPDSDGDGKTDGDEVDINSDPNDPRDYGQSGESDNSQVAIIKLTVGDPSGSHSERYTINIGGVSHQSPGFGLVGSGDYPFKPGKYPITITWVATNIGTPDYDYTAAVEKVSGDGLTVTVNDPSGLLGYHYESHYDFTLGKQAELVVGCVDDVKDPRCIQTCEECFENSEFFWDSSNRQCKKKFEKDLDEFYQKPCACKKCKDWYEQEMKDTAWLEEVNSEYPCPCKGDNYDESVWAEDTACGGVLKYFLCPIYHPGADYCLRSETPTSSNARQQCCYDKYHQWIPSGSSLGAGTPDKSFDNRWVNRRPREFTDDHEASNIDTFDLCCKECTREDHCDFYIDGARKGPDTCV